MRIPDRVVIRSHVPDPPAVSSVVFDSGWEETEDEQLYRWWTREFVRMYALLEPELRHRARWLMTAETRDHLTELFERHLPTNRPPDAPRPELTALFGIPVKVRDGSPGVALETVDWAAEQAEQARIIPLMSADNGR